MQKVSQSTVCYCACTPTNYMWESGGHAPHPSQRSLLTLRLSVIPSDRFFGTDPLYVQTLGLTGMLAMTVFEIGTG